jgi:hypothetical protein
MDRRRDPTVAVQRQRRLWLRLIVAAIPAGKAAPLRAAGAMIKLTETREITPYLRVHPDEKR